jgi:hypothetical protein
LLQASGKGQKEFLSFCQMALEKKKCTENHNHAFESIFNILENSFLACAPLLYWSGPQPPTPGALSLPAPSNGTLGWGPRKLFACTFPLVVSFAWNVFFPFSFLANS